MTGAAPAIDGEAEVSRALGRAALYRLLARAFLYPSPETLAALAPAILDTAPVVAPAPALGDALGALAGAAREAEAADIAAEHGRLFDGAVACPPCEGAWGDAPQMAGKGAQLADIAGFYAAFGLSPAPAAGEIEDHVGAELEFMSALALREAGALAEGHAEGLEVVRAAEVAFLTDHLGRWAAAFAGALAAASALPYYRAAGALLERWVTAEVEALGAAPARAVGRMAPGAGEAEAFTCPMVPEEPAG